jgi:hypothetical protein
MRLHKLNAALAALAMFGSVLETSEALADITYQDSVTQGAPIESTVVKCLTGNQTAAGNTTVAPCSSTEICQTPVVSTSAYTSGYAVGGLIALTIPLTAAGQMLMSVRLDFLDAQTVEFDVYQLAGNPVKTSAAGGFKDSATPSIDPTDVFKVLPPIILTTGYSGLGTHTVYGADQISRSLARSTAIDYFVIVTKGTPTLGAVNDMQFCAAYI